MRRHSEATEKRIPHTKLAEQLTLLVHGERGLDLARKTTDILYKKEASGSAETLRALSELSADDAKVVFEQADFVRLLFSAGMSLLEFAMKVGCFKVEKDAQKVIAEGGFYVNQVRRQNTEEIVMPGTHILPNNMTIVRVGKRNYYIVDWTF